MTEVTPWFKREIAGPHPFVWPSQLVEVLDSETYDEEVLDDSD